MYHDCMFKPTGAVAFTTAQFGVGSDPVHLDEVGCSGSESNLIDCSRSFSISCYEGGAGVRCQGRYLFHVTIIRSQSEFSIQYTVIMKI